MRNHGVGSCRAVGQVFIASLESILNVDSGRHRVHYRIELGKHRIACVVHHLSAMGFDGAGDKVEIFAEGAMSRVLILSGQTALARHVRIKDGGMLSWQTVPHAEVPFFELRLTANTTPGRGIGGRANGSNGGLSGRSIL